MSGAAHGPVKPLLLDFRADAPLEDVLKAVEIAYRNSGCSPCGRLSLVIQALLGDPGPEAFQSVRSLRTAVRFDALGGPALSAGGTAPAAG